MGLDKHYKQQRKHRRCEKRRNNRTSDICVLRYMDEGLSLSDAKSQARYGFFWENGVQRQICDWAHTCDYPCNGDC